MRKYTYIIYFAAMLFMVACNSRKNANDVPQDDAEIVAGTDSLRLDTLHHLSPDNFEDGHMPPPPPDGRGFDGPPTGTRLPMTSIAHLVPCLLTNVRCIDWMLQRWSV